MSARYEITCDDDVATVTAPGGVTDSFSRHGTSTDRFGYGAIRQLQQDLAAVTAERDSYRDQFSGLCLTLSVGSEGRPGMTAEDWRRRVDEGIDFLTRPLIAEISKRSKMLDICTQNCSDWIGKWRAEQERAEQAETQLAAVSAEMDELRSQLSELGARLTDSAGRNIALISERDQLRAQLAEYAEAPTVENEMTNNYATIRTALESARDYITTDLASERGAFEGHECVSRIDEIKVDLAENALALADLAELEKATRVPVGNVIQEQDGSTGVIWADVPAFGSKLYAAPPVPAVGVTDEVARKVFNAWIDARWRMNEGQDVKYGHAMIGVVQAELGPALGLAPARADAEIAELRRLLGDAREVIEDARIWLAIDPRGREQDLFVIAHLLERIDAAQGVDLCGDHHASTVSACCCVMYPAATR